MKTNTAPLDRALRVGLGFFFFATPALELGTAPYNFLGLLVMATGFIGFCPLYSLLRIRTLKLPEQRVALV
jgi:hypothetical protein